MPWCGSGSLGGGVNSAPQTPHLLFLAYWRWLVLHSRAPRRCRVENGVRRSRGRRGAATIEFALIGSAFLMLLLGGMDAARYLATIEAVRSASAEAARMAVLRGSANLNAGSAACTGLAGPLSGTPRSPLLDAAALSVALSGCTTSGTVTSVTVTASYPFAFALPWFGTGERVITEAGQVVFN